MEQSLNPASRDLPKEITLLIAKASLFWTFVVLLFLNLSSLTSVYIFQENFSLGTLALGLSLLTIVASCLCVVSNKTKNYPEDHWSRRSFIYTNLLVSGAASIYLSGLLFSLWLNGEDFVARETPTLVALVLLVWTFGHFWLDLSWTACHKSLILNASKFLVSFVTIASLLLGYVTHGSPAQIKNHKVDFQRIQRLANTDEMIMRFYMQNKKLPDLLSSEEFTKFTSSYNTFVRDPETDEVCEYKVTGEYTYELCLNLRTDMTKDEERYLSFEQDLHKGKNWVKCEIPKTMRHVSPKQEM